MKTCKVCGLSKPITEFYVKRENFDGRDNWCKTDRNVDNVARRKQNHQPPPSTRRVMELFRTYNIPFTAGRFSGFPSVDLVAYGYIRVEAKSAIPIVRKNGNECYKFGFTKAQKETIKDQFVVLIARGKRERVFVIPPGIDFQGQKLCITLNSACPDRNTEHIERFENAFHLIKKRVITDLAAEAA